MPPPAWIFGYGSLVWRPAFPFRQRRAAYVRGWTRRFWQGSTDHRGRPGSPGRVVTLVAEPAAVCWGMAYELEPASASEVLDLLDVREKGGYKRHELPLYWRGEVAAGEPNPGLVYVATEGNKNYLGPAPLAEIAAQVRGSHGPSGANLEYVLQLADALRTIEANDEHVFALEELLRATS